MSEYTPPKPKNVVFNFEDSTYSSPKPGNVSFNFEDKTSASTTIYPFAFEADGYGTPSINGAIASLYAKGFDSSVFAYPVVFNNARVVAVTSFTPSVVERPKIYNYKQYLPLNDRGIASAVFGTAYVQGGVKTLEIKGLYSNVFGSLNVINTKADQYADLNGKGIPPFAVTAPVVNPRHINPTGIKSEAFGQTGVRRNPSPLGFVATAHGVQWVSHSPRYLTPGFVTAFEPGYPKIFDPTQKIYVTTVIAGGVFGDIAVRNKSRFINVKGIDSQEFGDWSTVASNLRYVQVPSAIFTSFGESQIRNKTPNLSPSGIESLVFEQQHIGYRIRTLSIPGLNLLRFGTPNLVKTPSFTPKGADVSIYGKPAITHKHRSLFVAGVDTSKIGEAYAWYRYRNITPDAKDSQIFGNGRIEHGERELIGRGDSYMTLGNPQVWFAVRYLSPVGIDVQELGGPLLGRSRTIQALGFDASAFGTRIIPESKTIYPEGLKGEFGLTEVGLWRRHLGAKSFRTVGTEELHRWGKPTIYNLRQYIVQDFDPNNGLTPPVWPTWTRIENRNKVVGATGTNMANVAKPHVQNKSRPLKPNGFDASIFKSSMIAYRIRHLHLDGLEAPYMGGWSVVHNKGKPVKPVSFNAQLFGNAAVVNNRRYFNRIGNFESLEFGRPMVAYRVRRLEFEPRYTISPPAMALPKVDLYTRYIEPIGKDYYSSGAHSLEIHWTLITPRWTLQNLYGFPAVKNVTPQLYTRGRLSEEFGNTSVRLQWRPIYPHGWTESIKGPTVEFTTRKITMSGFNASSISDKIALRKSRAPAYTEQYIRLNSFTEDGQEAREGYGIRIPNDQVSEPQLNQHVIYARAIDGLSFGYGTVHSNGIIVNPGLQELSVGKPAVTLGKRFIEVPGFYNKIEPGNPRLSPHTIYAVMEAPHQAVLNHPSRRVHYVNSDEGEREPGEVFGNTHISLRFAQLKPSGTSMGRMGNDHTLSLRKQVIDLDKMGFHTFRMGWHVLGPFDQVIESDDPIDLLEFGRPSVAINYRGNYQVKPVSIPSTGFGSLVVDFFHRQIKLKGDDMLNMGTGSQNDRPFMWQRLRVGPLVPGNYGGFAAQVFGNTAISLKVREIRVKGFTEFASEYDYTAFDKRMRVVRVEKAKPIITVHPLGFVATQINSSNIKNKVQYIRPDGNADQYRKGAF